MASARARAAKAGVAFDLTGEDIAIPDVCPVLGIPLVRGAGRPVDGSPSIDRLLPDRGYVRGNVVVVSHKANRIKNDATIDELEKLVDFYSRLLRPAKVRKLKRTPT